MDGPNCEIDRLPEACLSHLLSFTSPRDSCRAAVVSPTFRQAADSDIVWSRFLPPDYLKILSRAVDSVSFSSCKELYFKLCDPVLIDGGKKVFALEKETGAKRFTLGAKELHIPRVDDERCWRWVSHPESRFTEVAVLLNDSSVEVECSISSSELSPKTTYKSYLIFKLAPETYGLILPPQLVSVKLGTQFCYGDVSVERIPEGQGEFGIQVRLPRGRLDGWMEVELGEFHNEDGSEGDVTMSYMHVLNPGAWKSGLIVEGVQVRPSVLTRESLVAQIKKKLADGSTPSEIHSFLSSIEGMSTEQKVVALFEALFDGAGKGFAKEVGKKKKYLTMAVQDEETQMHLLKAVECFCANASAEAVKEVALALMVLYDADLAEEETIVEWYEKGTADDKSRSSQMWKNVQPFAEWLQSAESGSEDE